MLGIADRSLVFDLFETRAAGDAAGALDRMDGLYQGGADPLMVLQDLLELTHFLTRLKLAPEAGAGDPLEDGERERARPLAAALSMPVLARAWQMLLKGLEEVQAAPSPAQAAAMVLVRLAYVADLPAPADLVRALTAGGTPVGGRAAGSSSRRWHRTAGASPASAAAAAQSGGRRRAAARASARRAAAAGRSPRRSRSIGARRPCAELRADAAELCRGRRAVRQAARGGASPRISRRMSISSASSRAGSSSARPRRRRAT